MVQAAVLIPASGCTSCERLPAALRAPQLMGSWLERAWKMPAAASEATQARLLACLFYCPHAPDQLS